MTGNKNLIIILAASLILLTAGVYYMSQVNQMSQSDSSKQFKALTKQSSSDDIDSIESDLNSTDFKDTNKEVLGIETELNLSPEVQTK